MFLQSPKYRKYYWSRLHTCKKVVCNDFELSEVNLSEFHIWFVQSDKLLLNCAFNNFQNMCVKIYRLDPAHFVIT